MHAHACADGRIYTRVSMDIRTCVPMDVYTCVPMDVHTHAHAAQDIGRGKRWK